MLIITLSVVWAESVKQLMRKYNKRTNLYAIFKFLYSFSMYITLLKKNIKISSIRKSATYNYLLYFSHNKQYPCEYQQASCYYGLLMPVGQILKYVGKHCEKRNVKEQTCESVSSLTYIKIYTRRKQRNCY